MATEYTIYIVNQGATQKTFWSFLQPPEELAADPSVFANSSARLAVVPNSKGINRFVIPVQFVVGAGASNNAVGLNTRVISDYPQNTELGQAWLADYATVPPPRGPEIKPGGSTQPDLISITSNNFNRVENEANQWFSNMSFGVQTSAGYMGMTWAPAPGDTRTLSPKLSFYISTGSFGSNELAKWTTVNNQAAEIELGSFQNREVTVTLTASGSWDVTPGRPPAMQSESESLSYLLQSQLELARANSSLIQLVRNSDTLMLDDVAMLESVAPDECQQDAVESVRWDSELGQSCGTNLALTGTLTVSTALKAGFAVFTLAGVKFDVTSGGAGDTRIGFSYSGTRSAEFIMSLFRTGAELFFCRS